MSRDKGGARPGSGQGRSGRPEPPQPGRFERSGAPAPGEARPVATEPVRVTSARDSAPTPRPADQAPARLGPAAAGMVPAAALLPLRFFFGATFLYAGFDKILDPAFFDPGSPTSIQSQMTAFARVSPIAPIIRAGEPFAVAIGLLIAVAEIAVGLGALTGLAYRLSAVGGALLSALFWLTASWATHPYYYGPDLPYAAGWLVLAAAGHGNVLVPTRLVGGGAPVRGVAARPARAGARGERHRRLAAGVTSAGPDSPTRRAFLQGGILAVAAVVLATVAAPLRILRSPLASAAETPTGGTGTPGEGTGATGGPAARPTSVPAITPGVIETPAPTAASGGGGVVIGTVAQVQKAGALAFTVPFDAPASLPAGDPAVIVRLADGSFVAFDAVCTHAGCTVEWDSQDAVLLCPCHGAAFDPARNGRVLQGPTRQPLAALPLTVDKASGSIMLRA